MPKPAAKPLTWGKILDGAARLDAQYDTTRYGNAVVARMLAHALAKKAASSKVYFVVGRRPPPTAQQKLARQRARAG